MAIMMIKVMIITVTPINKAIWVTDEIIQKNPESEL